MTLKGNSGCSLDVKDTNVVVKKATGSYVSRLKAQMEKQIAFQGKVVDGYSFIAEAVLSSSEEKDSFLFEMPLDKSQTAAELIRSGSSIKDLSEVFADFLLSNLEHRKIENAEELISNKLKSLEKTVPAKYASHIKVFEDKLAAEIHSIPAGYCHGDFTLENILVDLKTKSIHLIDFLDSFIDSPLLDFATILQDTKCLWSYRYEALAPDERKSIEAFNSAVESRLKELGIYRQVEILLLLKLYRILPYAKDDVTREFLDANIVSIEKELQC